MRRRSPALLAAGLSALIFGPGEASAEYTGLEFDHDVVYIDGECRMRVRVYAAFDDPLDQLFSVSGNASNPVVITTDAATGFYQPADPTGATEDTAHTAFATDFSPELAFDTFVTIDNTGQFVSDGLTVLHLDGSGGTAGNWNAPTAFGFDSLVLINAGWRKEFGARDTFATDGRVALGQFTTEPAAELAGTMRLGIVSDGVAKIQFESFVFVIAGGFDCLGNTNCDRIVNVDDIVNVILDFGTDGFVHNGDQDGNGITDVDDIVTVVTHWGFACLP